jgi:hypothetical protein
MKTLKSPTSNRVSGSVERNVMPPSGKPVGQWRHAQVTGTGGCAGLSQPAKRACRSETAAATGGETRLNCACNVHSPSRVVLAVIGVRRRHNAKLTDR